MEKLNGIITPEEAKQLSDAFTPRSELISRDITKRPDNRSSWFALKDIRAYLDYAEKQAKEHGHEMNGIRIYCGAYPEKDGKPGYSTSFIVPTADIPSGKDGGGDNADLPGGDGLNKGGNGIPPGTGYPQQ